MLFWEVEDLTLKESLGFSRELSIFQAFKVWKQPSYHKSTHNAKHDGYPVLGMTFSSALCIGSSGSTTTPFDQSSCSLYIAVLTGMARSCYHTRKPTTHDLGACSQRCCPSLDGAEIAAFMSKEDQWGSGLRHRPASK